MLVIAGLCIGLAMAEGLLRIRGVSFPLPYTTDSNCGTRLQPGFHAWFHEEGDGYVEVNEWGFRDLEHTQEKPNDVFRIAVLGDSYAEALQVMREETFWSVMQDELQRADIVPGKRVEVLNFGVSGFGTAQELQVLQNHVWQFDPDIVLLLFVPGNDIRNNSKRLESNQTKPFFDLHDGKLVLDNSFRQHPDYLRAQTGWTQAKVWLINRSRILQLVNEVKNRRPRGETGPEKFGSEPGLDESVFLEPADETWNEAWDIAEQLLVKINEESQRRHVLFVVAVGTSAIQVHPDQSIRTAYQERLQVDDLLYPDRRLEELGKRYGFPVVGLTMPMRESAETDHVFLHGFTNTRLGTGHWNVQGHASAGRLLADRVGAILVSRQSTGDDHSPAGEK